MNGWEGWINTKGDETIHTAILGNYAKLSTFLNPLVVTKVDSKGQTLLHYIAAFGNVRHAELCLQHGGDIHAKTHAGKTPLHIAAVSGNIQLCIFLLNKGASKHDCDNKGFTPYALASHAQFFSCADLLR